MSSDYLIISTSLNPESKSRILAKTMYEILKNQVKVELIDLASYNLPICDGDIAYSDANVDKLTKKIEKAAALILAVPIYNYAGSAAAKNLIELTGSAWNDKVVGFLCAAGGRSSYMSIMNLANSLMLDFRCIINPRFVYADGAAFQGDRVADSEIQKRIDELAASTIKLTGRITTLSGS
jgi:NAD(P)H-dependent FMN reductase